MPLGSFTLEPGQDHRIELRNVGSVGRMNADAVRLVYEGERLMVAADAVRFVPNAISGAAYVHGDHLGTPAKMTGDAGTVIWDAAYKPFGGEASVVGSENLDLRFPGQIQDLESGRGLASLVMPLHYNYFRDYDPASGRYLQVDPIGLAGGLNTYGYVSGNPLKYSDPTGQWLVFVRPIAKGAAVGGANAVYQAWQNDWNWECVDWHKVADAALAGTGLPFLRALAGASRAARALRNATRAGKPPKTGGDPKQSAQNSGGAGGNGGGTGVAGGSGSGGGGEGGGGGSGGGDNRFPKNPNDLMSDLPRDSKGRIHPSDNVRIRPEQHSRKSGETYSSRHHGQHYHVETRLDSSKSWNNKKNVIKIKPLGYKKGQGTGFLPGEKFPGAN
jgi:RHS repeat-associated protein